MEDKRLIRKLKKEVKKAGSRHRRRELKKNLIENPELAHEAEENLGKHQSQVWNAYGASRKRSDNKDESSIGNIDRTPVIDDNEIINETQNDC